MKSVTTALREVFAELGLRSDFACYSDARKPANLPPGYKAVGVKIRSLFPTTADQKQQIVQKMLERGYYFHYIRPVYETARGSEVRFCFSKPESAAVASEMD